MQEDFTQRPGLNPTPQDVRDYVFGSERDTPRKVDFEWDTTKLPKKVDLRPFCGSIENQYSTNSCVGNAICSAVELQEFKSKNNTLDFSRLFVYYNAREAASNGQPVTDTGSNIRLALAQMTKMGVCYEYFWPFDNNQINTKPNQYAYETAKGYFLDRYEVMGTRSDAVAVGGDLTWRWLNDVKVALASGYPVVFGMHYTTDLYNVTGPLDTHKSQYTEEVVRPNHEKYAGGHCMLIVGYDEDLQSFIIENSWGNSFGENGFLALTYQTVLNNVDLFGGYVLREIAGIRYEIPEEFYIRKKESIEKVEAQPEQTKTENTTPVVVEEEVHQPAVQQQTKSKSSSTGIILAILAVLVLTALYFSDKM